MSLTDYLEHVRATDWSPLRGAYRDFPLTRNLLALAESEWDELPDIAGAVLGFCCHQDVLEPAAPPVADALIRLVDDDRGAWPMRILLAFAVAAQPPLHRALGFLPARWPFGGHRPASGAASFAARLEYRRRAEATLRVLVSGLAHLERAVGSSNAEARLLAIRLLALVPSKCLRAGETLRKVVRSFALDTERAQALTALAARGETLDEDGAATLSSAADPIVQAAAVAAVLSRPGGHTRIGDDDIARLLQIGTLDSEDQFPWCGGGPGGLVADALVRSDASDERVLKLLIGALREWTSHSEDILDVPEGRVADQIGERLFHRVFAEHLGRRDHLTRDDLTPRQREVLEQIDGLEELLAIAAPTACGIRDLWADRERLIGSKTGGLDRIVVGVFVGERSVCWPVWKWWLEADTYARYAYPGEDAASRARDLVTSILRSVLTADARRAALDDASTGAYGVDSDALRQALEPRDDTASIP